MWTAVSRQFTQADWTWRAEEWRRSTTLSTENCEKCTECLVFTDRVLSNYLHKDFRQIQCFRARNGLDKLKLSVLAFSTGTA